MVRTYLNLIVFFALTLMISSRSYAQRVYATKQTSVPATKTGGSEIKDQEKPVEFPRLDDHSKIEVKSTAGSAYQILSFDGIVEKNTPVRLRLRVRKGLSLLNTITIQAVNGTTAVSPGYQINNLAGLLVEDQEKEIILFPSQDYDGVQILTRALFADIEIEIFYAYYIAPPPISVNPVVVCKGDPAELSVSPIQAGYTYRWYTTPTGGSAFVSNSTGICITPPLSATTTFYVEALESLGGAVSARVPVEVQVKPSPALAVIPLQKLCEGESIDLTTLNPLDENGSTTGSYKWSLLQGGTALLSTTVTPFVGTATYWVRYTHNNCFDDATVSITTAAKPNPITFTLTKN